MRRKVVEWMESRYGLIYLIVILLGLLSVRHAQSSEQAIHHERDEAVVTLVDRDRSDPFLFRWVLVISLDGTWSTLIDRESGRVLQCVGRARTREIRYVDGVPKLRLGECVTVWEGVVQPKGSKR